MESPTRLDDSTGGDRGISGPQTRDLRVPSARDAVHHGLVVEALRVLLEILAVVALCTIAVYVVGFVVVAVSTVVGRARLDPLSEDLDRVLGEILGRSEGRLEDASRRGERQ